MIKFFHHLFNPHCPECALEHESARVCQSCETLKAELSLVREQNQQLLDTILHPKTPESPPTQVVEYKPLTKPHIPWSVRKQALETESKQKARILREHEKEVNAIGGVETKSIEELEKELGVVDATG